MPYHYGEPTPSPMSMPDAGPSVENTTTSTTTPAPFSTTTTTPMPVSMSGYMSTTTTTPAPEDCCTPNVLSKYGPNDKVPAGRDKGTLFRLIPGWKPGDWWWGDEKNNIFTENNINLAKPPKNMVVHTWEGCWKINPKAMEGSSGIHQLKAAQSRDPASSYPGRRAQFANQPYRFLWIKCPCCPEKDWRPKVSRPPAPAKPTEPTPTEPTPTEPTPTEPTPGSEDKPIETKPGGGAGPDMKEHDKWLRDRNKEAEEEEKRMKDVMTPPGKREIGGGPGDEPQPDPQQPSTRPSGQGELESGEFGGILCCNPVTYWWTCPPANVEINVYSSAARRVVPVRGQVWCDTWIASLAASKRFPTAGEQNGAGNRGYNIDQFNDDLADVNLRGVVVGWCVDAEWRQNQAGKMDKKGIVPNLGKVKVHDLKKCKCFRVRPGKEADVKKWFFVPPTAAGGTYNYKNQKSPSGPSMWEECKCCPGWQGKVTKFRRMGVQRAGKPGGAPREETVWLVRKDFEPDGTGEFTRAKNKFWCPPPF